MCNNGNEFYFHDELVLGVLDSLFVQYCGESFFVEHCQDSTKY